MGVLTDILPYAVIDALMVVRKSDIASLVVSIDFRLGRYVLADKSAYLFLTSFRNRLGNGLVSLSVFHC